MYWFYHWFFTVIWIAFMLYWFIAAANVKATERIESVPSRIFRSLLFLAAILLLMLNHIRIPWLYRHFLPVGYWTFYGGAVITMAGLLFAVWARVHIGANWSRSVTIKQDHELITSGPYRLVRHPIYTGILTGFLGTALAVTQYRGILAFVLVFLSLWYKLRLEEQWMRKQFGDTYADYSRRTAALVPSIL
jgi:protein-S-isoprenylcysteine O-methyltransferase Ste14